MVRRQLSAAGARVPRSAIIVVGCLLLGLAAGALISSLALSRKAPRVSDTDYALIVANLYDHEKSVFNARERLSTLGKSSTEVVGGALETYARERPEDKQGIEALRQLDQGLRQAEADAQSQRSASSPGLIGVVGLILASVLLAAGVAWVWRLLEMRGLNLPSLATNRGEPRSVGSRGFASALATVVGSRHRDDAIPLVEPKDEVAATTPPTRRPARPATSSRFDDLDDLPPLGSNRAGRRPLSPEPAPADRVDEPLEEQRRAFYATYTLGEDNYDEIHPIHDERGDLVGACGLSATEQSDRPTRFYGFTAWLQDHVHPNELSAVGLVSRAGQVARSAAIAEWRRRGTIDEVYPVERGLQVGLRTSRVDALLTVEEFDYTPPAHGSPGYFARLRVRIEVGPAY